MTSTILVRLSDDEHSLIKQKAQSEERSLSNFVKRAVLRDISQNSRKSE